MTAAFSLTSAFVGNELPYLQLAPVDLPAEAPLAVVLHGLGSRKEKMLPAMFAFAQAGFRAVALDARLHGQRHGAEEREERLLAAYVPTLSEMIEGTAQDVSHLLDHLDVSASAIHGVSLGGYITFAALLSEPRLHVASVAMGSPDWLGPLRQFGLGPGHPLFDAIASRNPLDRAAATYPPRPLLLLHGDQDEVVAPDGVQALYERLQPVYRHFHECLKLVLYPGLGHYYTDTMLQETVDWFIRFMPR